MCFVLVDMQCLVKLSGSITLLYHKTNTQIVLEHVNVFKALYALVIYNLCMYIQMNEVDLKL